jgi:hypothetical protein
MCGDRPEMIAVTKNQGTVCGPAEGVCLFEYGIEDWGEVTGRRIDDLQYLGGRRLLFQRLVTLSFAVRKLPLEFGDYLLRIA